MASRTAVRFVAAAKPPHHGRVLLNLRVKPGASKSRQGLIRLTDEAIELCVAAPPRDGAANRAVIALLSDLLGVPKSRMEMVQGGKSRDKTVVLHGETDGESCSQRIYDILKRKQAE